MNIVVCVKQVPDTWSERTLKPADSTLDRESADAVINELDEYAIEEGLRIAEASGGAPYMPKETSDIDKVCQQVAKDIRSQYIIEYNPIISELDGSFRSIKVVANAPNRPTVRTRSGYYASPEKGAASSATSAKK